MTQTNRRALIALRALRQAQADLVAFSDQLPAEGGPLAGPERELALLATEAREALHLAAQKVETLVDAHRIFQSLRLEFNGRRDGQEQPILGRESIQQ